MTRRQALMNLVTQKWHRASLHPVTGTVLTMLLLLAGGFGSFWTTEIKNAFPFYWGHNGWTGLSPKAVTFWVTSFASGLMYLCRQYAVDKDLENKIQHLGMLIRTQPPRDFLRMFNEFYMLTERLQEAVAQGKYNQEEVERAIRLVLNLLCELAQKFDGDHADYRYAANVMVFRPIIDIAEKDRIALKERLRFCDPDTHIDALHGVLELRVELSTATNVKTGEVDSNLSSLVLPIPKTPLRNDKFYVVPGASFSFVTGRLEQYVDSDQLLELCQQKCDFNNEIPKQVEEYFRGTPDVRSFVCVPLFHGDFIPEATHPFAILNIHCDRTQLLAKTPNSLEDFAYIIAPQLRSIKQMLDRLPTTTKWQQDTEIH